MCTEHEYAFNKNTQAEGHTANKSEWLLKG